jgi:hypothetical protein
MDIQEQGVQGKRPEGTDPTPVRRHRYVRVEGRITLADIIKFADENDIVPEQLNLPWPTLQWLSPETPDEVAERVAQNQRAAERRERWERETYEQLRARFEGGGS